VDASSFGHEIDNLPKFVITQIEESVILCLNKVDIADHEYLISVRQLLKTINPDARIFEFSAKMLDEGFSQFIDELAGKMHLRSKNIEDGGFEEVYSKKARCERVHKNIKWTVNI
jgi:G3E family GTPase